MNARFKPLAAVFILCAVVLAGIGIIFYSYYLVSKPETSKTAVYAGAGNQTEPDEKRDSNLKKDGPYPESEEQEKNLTSQESNVSPPAGYAAPDNMKEKAASGLWDSLIGSRSGKEEDNEEGYHRVGGAAGNETAQKDIGFQYIPEVGK